MTDIPTLRALAALAALLLAAPAASAQILDDLWVDARISLRLAEYASSDGGATDVPPQSPLAGRRARVVLHVEATAGDGVETDASYDVSVYRQTKTALELVDTATMTTRGGTFRGLVVDVPLEGGKGKQAATGTATVRLNGRFVVKSVNGQIVRAKLSSLGGSVDEASYTLGDGATVEATGLARLRGRSVSPDKLPPIAED